MKIKGTSLLDLKLISPDIYDDERGYFFESYKTPLFKEYGLPYDFPQDNEVKSKKGVLRGLRYQLLNPQGKLIRVVSGAIFDVAVDVRKGSPSFGCYESKILTSENKKMLYVPEGFAHGYLVLSDEAIVTYKCTDIYYPDDQHGILWNDPDIGIDWNNVNPILSQKDQILPILSKQTYLPEF